MLATVCLPDGCSFSIGSPFVALIRCREWFLAECGMWLGLAGILSPIVEGVKRPKRLWFPPRLGEVLENSANQVPPAGVLAVEVNESFVGIATATR
jgi:hypothetical protein